jgi:hypothetical protein
VPYITQLLNSICTQIPQTVVLEKISNPPLNKEYTGCAPTAVTGVTTDLIDLSHFVAKLEKELGKNCSLSYIKEHRSSLRANGTTPVYAFSFTIDA